MQSRKNETRIRTDRPDPVRYILPFFCVSAAHVAATLLRERLGPSESATVFAVVLFVWAGISYGMFQSHARGSIPVMRRLALLFAASSAFMCTFDAGSSFLHAEALMSASIIAAGSAVGDDGSLRTRDSVPGAVLFALSFALLALQDADLSAVSAVVSGFAVIVMAIIRGRRPNVS